eukprot:scaffold247758_cov27-Tisochrysis_lutea.AAC.2
MVVDSSEGLRRCPRRRKRMRKRCQRLQARDCPPESPESLKAVGFSQYREEKKKRGWGEGGPPTSKEGVGVKRKVWWWTKTADYNNPGPHKESLFSRALLLYLGRRRGRKKTGP